MTTAPTPDLLPCPFCGGPASAHEVNQKEAPGWVRLTVAHTPDCFSRAPKESLLLSAADLERWNRRAELEARKPLTDGEIIAAKDRLRAQQEELYRSRIGLQCANCQTGKYRADGNGYHNFHRCDKCMHVPMWGADGNEFGPAPLIARREVVADGPVRVTRLHLSAEGRAALTTKAAGPLPGPNC